MAPLPIPRALEKPRLATVSKRRALNGAPRGLTNPTRNPGSLSVGNFDFSQNTRVITVARRAQTFGPAGASVRPNVLAFSCERT